MNFFRKPKIGVDPVNIGSGGHQQLKGLKIMAADGKGRSGLAFMGYLVGVTSIGKELAKVIQPPEHGRHHDIREPCIYGLRAPVHQQLGTLPSTESDRYFKRAFAVLGTALDVGIRIQQRAHHVCPVFPASGHQQGLPIEVIKQVRVAALGKPFEDIGQIPYFDGFIYVSLPKVVVC